MEPKLLQKLWFNPFEDKPDGYAYPKKEDYPNKYRVDHYPAPPPVAPENSSYCSVLRAEKELECLNKLFRQELPLQRMYQLKDQLDALIDGRLNGVKKVPERQFDDGDGLNIDFDWYKGLWFRD